MQKVQTGPIKLPISVISIYKVSKSYIFFSEVYLFNYLQAARYIALKRTQNELKLPVRVSSVGYRADKDPPEKRIDKTNIWLWVLAAVVVPLVAFGVLFRKRKVVAKLWNAEPLNGVRRESLGGEVSNEMRLVGNIKKKNLVGSEL